MIQGKDRLQKISGFLITGTICVLLIFAGEILAQRPHVSGTFPRNGSQNLLCNTFVSVTLTFPSEGKTLDRLSIHGNSIKLLSEKNPDIFIPAELSYKEDINTLLLQPLEVLEPFTNYIFEITHFLQNERGESFMPFKMVFKTGDCLPEEEPIAEVEPEPEPEIEPDTISGPELDENGMPIPYIDLVAFKALYENDTVKISWRTYEEFMIADYTVDRSYDGDKFVIIDRISSQGDSKETQYYKWNDINQSPGPLYYRLTVADVYGKLYQSDTINLYVEDIRFAETSIRANSTLSVEFAVKEKTTMAFVLRSENNKIVKRRAGAVLPGDETFDISLEGIEPGRYMAVLQTATKTIIEQILIME